MQDTLFTRVLHIKASIPMLKPSLIGNKEKKRDVALFLKKNKGKSVSLCGDGTLLAIGAPSDNNAIGATWVFLFNESSLSYERFGDKLIGEGYDAIGNTPINQGKAQI